MEPVRLALTLHQNGGRNLTWGLTPCKTKWWKKIKDMARKARQKSATGIYHVMLRGINKQNIFFSEEDMVKMLFILRDAQYKRNAQGKIETDNLCTIYAHCILDNHIHVLIKEGLDDISTIMKKVEDRYAAYYNLRYERVGHLFQGRFPSEPVNDGEYFHTLLRYIHRNSVKAMEARTPESYPYSSWNEYVSHESNIVRVLKPSAMAAVFKLYPLKELTEWVNMDVDDRCMDMDSFKNVITDKDAMEIVSDISILENPEDFRLLDHQTQIRYLIEAIDAGISQRQAARIGTVTLSQISHAYKIAKTPIDRSDVSADLSLRIHEEIKNIEGVGKLNKHRLYLIAEFLLTHPDSKCSDIATHIAMATENTRRLIIKLINNNVVMTNGMKKGCTYSIKTVEETLHGV